MKKKLLMVLLGLSACSCPPAPEPVKVNTTDNKYQVAKLFENEGCVVWRFYDEEEYRYYTICKNVKNTSTGQDFERLQGKVHRNIPSNINVINQEN